MAKSRKNVRKAKRTTGKRKTMKAKARGSAKRSRRVKRRKQTSIIDAVRETGELRRRLAGHNTFED